MFTDFTKQNDKQVTGGNIDSGGNTHKDSHHDIYKVWLYHDTYNIGEFAPYVGKKYGAAYVLWQPQGS